MELEKTNAPGYFKDKKRNVVINRNDVQYQQVLASREKSKKNQEIQNKVESLEDKVDQMCSQVNDIRNLLTRILEKNG